LLGEGDITRTNTRPFIQKHFPSVVNPSITNNHSWLVMQNGRNGGYANPDGYPDAGAAVTSTTVGTGLHEMGHLWGLWDEYDTNSYYPVYRNGPNTRSNVNLSNPTGGILDLSIFYPPSNNKNTAIPAGWGLFIGQTAGINNQWQGFGNIGIYQMVTASWGSTIWYRPHQQCRMRSSTNPFCHVL